MRYLLYSHDGFGLGHTRRHLAIARALTQLNPDASVLLASGSEEAHRFGLPPRVEILKLPALRKVGNGHYVARRLPIPSDHILSLRSELLCTSMQTFRPDVVLADKHPFGVCGEFRAALEFARNSGIRCVLGLRDILDDPAAVRREWKHQHDEIPLLFDRVLIYGEQNVFDPITHYEFAPAVVERTRFCGYVLNEPEIASLPDHQIGEENGRPLVIATAGGGEDGFSLLKHVLLAAKDGAWRALVVTGPMIPDAEFELLAGFASQANATLCRFRPNLHHVFRSADVLVCMGGYNTLVEAAAAGVPTICVPRVTPRREQAMRAQAFEKLGLLHALDPLTLTPKQLRETIDLTIRNGRGHLPEKNRGKLHFDGAFHAAQHLRELAQLREDVTVSAAKVVA